MLAVNLIAGAIVAAATTLGNTKFDQALDVTAKKVAGRHILEGRDATAVIQRRFARDRPDDEGGHLLTGDQTLGAIVTVSATAGDIQFGEALDIAAGPGIGRNVAEIGGANAVVRGRFTLDGPHQEGGHLLAGDETLWAIIAIAATPRDAGIADGVNVVKGPT